MEFYFTHTGSMPRPTVVTVSDLGSNPITVVHRGTLRAISPDEIWCAMLFALLLIHHATHDDLCFDACQLRENMHHTRTALQRIYEIARG